MMTVPLGGRVAAGRAALVDDGDYALVVVHRWCATNTEADRRRPPRLYALMAVQRPDGRRTTIKMHQFIMGVNGIDHINGDGLDNRRSNLRVATNSQNHANQRGHADTASKYKGVYSNAGNGRLWVAAITVSGRKCHLGCFDGEADAARAYDAAALAAWGEFARLNFPGTVA